MERAALTPSLFAPNLKETIKFYEDVFAFVQTGVWEDGGAPVWVEMSRKGPKGEARIWFFSDAINNRPEPSLSGVLYLFVDSVDAEVQRIDSRAQVQWGPEKMDYGLYELGVEDLNGYLICFAEDIAD